MDKTEKGDKNVNLFKIDSPVLNGLSRIFDILFLNILWVLCSIPIITIGASTAALYYCTFKINRENDTGIAKMFFKSSRQNFKQGCILTVIFTVSGLILYIDFQVCILMEGIFGHILKILILVLLIVWGIIVSYAFPLLAQFENSIVNVLKNSLLLSIMNIGKTIPVILINAIPFVLFWGLPYVFIVSIPVFLIFGIAFMGLVNSKILLKVFDKYM